MLVYVLRYDEVICGTFDSKENALESIRMTYPSHHIKLEQNGDVVSFMYDKCGNYYSLIYTILECEIHTEPTEI